MTETKVTLALDEVMKGRTTFVVAHRLATIRSATRILVFRNGRIVETGMFDELHRLGGFLPNLWRRSLCLCPSPPSDYRSRSRMLT